MGYGSHSCWLIVILKVSDWYWYQTNMGTSGRNGNLTITVAILSRGVRASLKVCWCDHGSAIQRLKQLLSRCFHDRLRLIRINYPELSTKHVSWITCTHQHHVKTQNLEISENREPPKVIGIPSPCNPRKRTRLFGHSWHDMVPSSTWIVSCSV